jgi:nitronate monooxygenase
MLHTAFTARFGVEQPIVQAGMGNQCGARLAAAVSEAGAPGSIGSIGGTPDRLVDEIRSCRAATSPPFAVNVVAWPWSPWALQLLDVALAEDVPVITLSFGDAATHVARCRDAGRRSIVQVQNLESARAAPAARPDAIVAQGNEAGGHTGRRGTLAFAAQVLDMSGDVPVLVAGGIRSGRGLAGVLAMGAAGAVVGTRFKASDEFEISDALKDALVRSDGSDTLYDEIFDDACGLEWPHRVTGRALRNVFVSTWEDRREALRAEVAKRSPVGFFFDLARDSATASNWAGESAGLIDRVRPAAEIVRTLVADAERALAAAARLVGSAP